MILTGDTSVVYKHKGIEYPMDKTKGFRVYKNNQRFTVKRFFNGLGWRVVARETMLILRDCSFYVNEKARLRMIDKGVTNQHSHIVCKEVIPILDTSPFDVSVCDVEIIYNPYLGGEYILSENHMPCMPQAIMVLRDGKMYGNNKTIKQDDN